ncbi:sensor histidine kinase [Planctomycetota bacterium]
MQCKEGTIRIVEIDGNVGYDRQGAFKQTHCILKDVTRQRAAECELVDYQKQLKSLASELTLTEERLRRSVATALHDQISQSLAMSKVKVGALRASVTDHSLNTSLGEIAETIGQTLSEVRSLTSRLSYPPLNVLGYEIAVERWLSDEIEKKYPIQTRFKNDGIEKPLSEDVRAVLFRGVRELLTNSVKHAQATEIGVVISRQADVIRTQVYDNGIGCDPDLMIRQSDGFGLLSVQEALERLGGRLFVESSVDQGVCVTMEAPTSKVSN